MTPSQNTLKLPAAVNSEESKTNRLNSNHETIFHLNRDLSAAPPMEGEADWDVRRSSGQLTVHRRYLWQCSLTFLHHTCSNSELGGVVGSSMSFGLPGLLLGYDHLFPLLDGHVSLNVLDLHLWLSYSLRKEKQVCQTEGWSNPKTYASTPLWGKSNYTLNLMFKNSTKDDKRSAWFKLLYNWLKYISYTSYYK